MQGCAEGCVGLVIVAALAYLLLAPLARAATGVFLHPFTLALLAASVPAAWVWWRLHCEAERPRPRVQRVEPARPRVVRLAAPADRGLSPAAAPEATAELGLSRV